MSETRELTEGGTVEDFARPYAQRSAWYVSWIEAAVITLATLALTVWSYPDDPFFVEAQFPWPVLVPALLALRYGVVAGSVSVALMVVVWLAASTRLIVPGEFPSRYFAGAEILVLLCGQFCSVWSTRLHRLRRVAVYDEERLDQLTRRHYLLRLSHDQLEQSLIAKPVTLRSALESIRRLIATHTGELPGADALLELLTGACQLESAALYPVVGGNVAPNSIGHVGKPQLLNVLDPLVRECMKTRTLVHVRALGDDAEKSAYMVAAPVVDSQGYILAVLVVERMSFYALNKENLATLTVLLGYYGDSIRRIASALVIQEMLPGCPLPFAEELLRVHRLWREARVSSALVALQFGTHPDRDLFRTAILRGMRDLDHVWEQRIRDEPVLLLLLPLAGRPGVEGFLLRIDSLIHQQYRIGVDAAGITPYVALLNDERPVVTLTLLLEHCGAER